MKLVLIECDLEMLALGSSLIRLVGSSSEIRACSNNIYSCYKLSDNKNKPVLQTTLTWTFMKESPVSLKINR